MMEQMTKNELDTGMHVKLRDGSQCVVTWFKELVLIDVKDGTYERLDFYNDNMTNIHGSEYDIVEVTDKNGIKIFAEETMTKTEAEEKFGIRIVD